MFRRVTPLISVCSLIVGLNGFSLTGQTVAVEEFDNETELTYRLPNNTKPDAYSIYLRTDIADGLFNFTGVVKINITVLETGNSITLHQNSSTIHLALLMNENGQVIPITKSFDQERDFLIFQTENYTLQPGEKLQLTIEYEGLLRPFDGFLHSSYNNSEGEKVWHAATRFQPSLARHAFPCFDEPALKATFDITIEHSSRYEAISNMPEIQRVVLGSRAVTSFQQSPLMSTYTVAFFVSDFKFKEKVNENGLRQRFYIQPGKIRRTTAVLNESVQLLSTICNYLQVNYSLPKIDEVAVPDSYEGFPMMENWGLITWKQSYYLPEKDNSCFEPKGRVLISAHEFAQQWFGNFVSPQWWSFLWLSEGMGALVAAITIDHVHPDWHVWGIFVIYHVQAALYNDETEDTSIPMTFYVENQSDIETLFRVHGFITCSKAGSVLRMFMHAFTEHSFRKGLRYYLTKSAYGAVSDTDLFEALERAVKEDSTLDNSMNVNDIFGSWSNQKGFPLLTVSRNYTTNSIEISQQKYFWNMSNSGPTTWWIPYNFDTAHNISLNVTTPDGWLPQGMKSKIITPSEDKNWTSDDWVVFNKQQTGFYRVLYDETNYKFISRELNTGDVDKIHPLTRAQILNDLDHFVTAERLPAAIFLDLMNYLKRETHAAPMKAAMDFLFASTGVFVEGSEEYLKRREWLCDQGEHAIHVLCNRDDSMVPNWFCDQVKEEFSQQCTANFNSIDDNMLHNGIVHKGRPRFFGNFDSSPARVRTFPLHKCMAVTFWHTFFKCGIHG